MSDVSHTPDSESNLTTLSEAQCFELLAVATVGRFGFVSPGGLQIIPVNYRLGAGHRIFVRTAPKGAIAQLAESRSHVAFQVDYHADDFRIAWSVLMRGTVGSLDAEAQAAYADLNVPPIPWPGQASSLPVQFVPKTVSGRGLHSPRVSG
jgi:nitroimidazol reductase NimA-like FMN-containing flavoprotein (pyridoxamine 5'-phosphate oxidase superfamily)